MSGDPIGAGLVRAVVDEIASLNYDGHIRGIALVFVDGDGDLSTRIAIGEGTKLPLLAGTVVLQRDVFALLRPALKRREP